MPRLPQILSRYQSNVDLFQNYITTHQNLIWGVSVVSGISLGWIGYASRKYHRKQIEYKVESVTKRLSQMEKKEITNKYFYRIAMPLCIICTCMGYGIGRFHSTWRSYKHFDRWKGDFVTNLESQMKSNMNNASVVTDMIKSIQQKQQWKK